MELATPREFLAAYTARVKALRQARFRDADMMAIALNISPSAYRKYESRTPLPAELVERFALIVGRSITYVVTGHEE